MIHVHSYWIWFPTSESGFRNGQSKQAMAFQRRKSSSSVLVHQVEKTPPPLLERETIMILLTSRLATSPLQQALVFRTWNLHGNTKPELLRFSISIHRLLSSRNRHSPVAIELQSCRVQRRRHFPLQTQLVYPTVRKGASAFIIIIFFFFHFILTRGYSLRFSNNLLPFMLWYLHYHYVWCFFFFHRICLYHGFLSIHICVLWRPCLESLSPS